MWEIFARGKRRSEVPASALEDALAEPLPLGAADIPLDVPLGPWASGTRVAVYLGGSLFNLLWFYFIFGLGFNLATLLLVLAHLCFAIGAGLPELSGLNRRLYISGEGIRLEKIHRTLSLPWWRLRTVQAKADISFIRALGDRERITSDIRSLPVTQRKEIVFAIRARLPSSIRIEEWPKGGQLLSLARSTVFSIAGVGLIAGASMIGVLGPGNVLGLRCSVNSAFLQRTFGTPERQGCVVLRVSAGAEEAGMRRGDLVIEMEGYPVTSGQQFSVLFEKSDRPWYFTVIRKGEPHPLRFKVSGGRGKDFNEDPNDPFFYYLRGRWDAAEKPGQAIKDYSRAIELQPDFDLAYLYRGELHEERGDWEAASRDYQKALELSPRLGEAHVIYAYFIDVEDAGAAQEHVNKAVELDHCSGAFDTYNVDCSTSYLLLASLLDAGQAGEMAAIAEQAIRFYDGFADNYFNAMCAYSILGDEIRAEEYAQRYLRFSQEERDPGRTELARRVRDGTGDCS